MHGFNGLFAVREDTVAVFGREVVVQSCGESFVGEEVDEFVEG